MSIRPKPAKSTFGGPSNSSVLSSESIQLMLFQFGFSDIIYDNKEDSYGDEYIRNIENCKIFYRNKINNMTDEYPFVGMRKRSWK